MVRLEGDLSARLNRASFGLTLAGDGVSPERVVPAECLRKKCEKVLGPVATLYGAYKNAAAITDQSLEDIKRAGEAYCAEECIGLEKDPRSAYERMVNAPVLPPRPRQPSIWTQDI